MSSNQNNDGWCDEHVATAGCPGCIEVEMRRLSADVRQLKEAIYWALGERDEYFLGENRLEADYKALAQQIQDVAESYCIALDQEASDQTDETDPYEAAGESRFGLPGGGTSL